MCLNNRTSPLDIYGPEGTIRTITEFLKLGYFNQTMPVTSHELEGGEVLQFPNYSVTVVAADHMVPALSFVLEEPERKGTFNPRKAKELGITEGPEFRRLQNGETIVINGSEVRSDMVMGKPRSGRKIAYTGDTRPVPEFEELVRGADVLIHESTFHSDMEEKSMEFGHTTSRQAAELAARAGVRKLFLTHISNRYSKDPSPLIDEAEEIFPEAELARDFLEYEVPKQM
jgi:ribonuclease Z